MLTGCLRSDDSFWCSDALEKMGVSIKDDGDCMAIMRAGKWLAPSQPVFIGSAGTTGRFLTSILAFSADVPVTINASEQLSSRPMAPLLAALEQAGARFKYLGKPGHFPVTILPKEPGVSMVEMSGSQSSQFISGMLLGAPLLGRPLEIRVTDEIVQSDYVRITLAMMRDFGVDVDVSQGFDRFTVQPSSYRGIQYAVEADASTASYFLALAAVTRGRGDVGKSSPRYAASPIYGFWIF